MSNVVQFPIKNREDVELEITKDILKLIIAELGQRGILFDEDSPMFEDLTVIFNILYSVLLRNSNHYHPWQDALDEMLLSLKSFYDDYEEHDDIHED